MSQHCGHIASNISYLYVNFSHGKLCVHFVAHGERQSAPKNNFTKKESKAKSAQKKRGNKSKDDVVTW